MNCPKCNAILEDGAKFCHACGANVEASVAATPVVETPVAAPVVETPVAPTPTAPQVKVVEKPYVPNEYQPLRPWTYFWLNVLFAVPVVGFVFLIIFSFSGGNINRRNYARSYWCPLLILAVIAVIFFIIFLIIAVIGGVSMSDVASSSMSYM